MARRIIRSLSALALTLVAAGAAAAVAPQCPPVAGITELFEAGTVLLVGELHGTEESPAFVGALACQALAAGLPLVVGLELFDSEQDRFEAFLASSGDAASRAAVLAGDPWRKHSQWGVTSEAMLGLLEELRRLHRGGGEVRVVLFNRRPDTDSQSRDRRMAEYLRAALEGTEEAFTLVLTGNIHSRVAKGTRWSRDYEPMGYLLREAVAPRRVLSLDVAHRGGAAWLCPSGEPCGAHRLGPRGPDGDGITWNDSPAETGHHGWYQAGEVTASPPAGHAAPAEPPAATAELLWQHDTGG